MDVEDGDAATHAGIKGLLHTIAKDVSSMQCQTASQCEEAWMSEAESRISSLEDVSNRQSACIVSAT